MDWYFYSLRTCNPETGRWLQQDPYDEFFSPYCAMGNNPANFTDPTGGFTGQTSHQQYGAGGTGQTGSGQSFNNSSNSTKGKPRCPKPGKTYENGKAGGKHKNNSNPNGGPSSQNGGGNGSGGNGFGNSGTQPMDGQANAPSSGGGGGNSGFSNPIFTNPLLDIIYPDHSKNEWKGVPYALPAGGEFDLGGGITLEAITLVGHRQEESSFAIPIGLAGLLSPEAISAIEGAITFGATMGAAIVGVLFIPGDSRIASSPLTITPLTFPTPTKTPGEFIGLKSGQGFIHRDTGKIYKKSKTSHGNKGNAGVQWKVYPKGTKDFSKQGGKRTTVDGDGNLIGN